MSEKEYLPIKVVIPRKEDYEKPPPAHSSNKIFGDEVTPSTREELASQLFSVRDSFADSFYRFPDVPAVAKVAMKQSAEAKSYRPVTLFNERTCPVIGVGRLGELFVSVSPEGLESVAHKIIKSNAKTVIANISALSNIRAWGHAEVMGEKEAGELAEACKRSKSKALKIRLFNHNSEEKNSRVTRAFKGLFTEDQIEKIAEVRYSNNISVYRFDFSNTEEIELLSGFVGIQSLSPFQDFGLIKTASTVIGAISHDDFPILSPEATERTASLE